LRADALSQKATAREKLRPALAIYEQAARVQPSDHVSWFHLARLYALLGAGDASASYERALQAQLHLGPKVKNVDLYYQAAAYFAKQGQTTRARDLVREALAFAGTHPGINALADALGARPQPSP
jgi:tetratricopeptide (TPR) repeat protein